jgi:hypothetical protein
VAASTNPKSCATGALRSLLPVMPEGVVQAMVPP